MNSRFMKECYKSALSHLCPSVLKSVSEIAQLFMKILGFLKLSIVFKKRTIKENKEPCSKTPPLENESPFEFMGYKCQKSHNNLGRICYLQFLLHTYLKIYLYF